MERLKKMTERDHTTLARVLFGLDSPSPVPSGTAGLEAEIGRVEFFDLTLNDSQKDAIAFALASRDVALIHGPPGVDVPAGFDYTADVSTDGQNLHADRAYTTDGTTQASCPGLRPL